MDRVLNYKGLGLPWAVEDTLDKLVAAVQERDDVIQQLQAQVTAIPPPLTLQQISQGLSATGAAPLNLTGLPGK